ncbi:hypothetical protein GCM10020001_089950 [Nonomuraea salmonea]
MPVTTAAIATWYSTIAVTSLNRPSPSSSDTMRLGSPSRPATAVAATGSGGATSAPSATAAASGSPGTSACATPATAAVVTNTSATASRKIGCQLAANWRHEVRWTAAYRSGGQQEGQHDAGRYVHVRDERQDGHHDAQQRHEDGRRQAQAVTQRHHEQRPPGAPA